MPRSKHPVTLYANQEIAPMNGETPLGIETQIVSQVVDTVVEVVRGANARADLRARMDAQVIRAHECHTVAGQIRSGYREMREEMTEETRRKYHDEYLAVCMDAIPERIR